MQIIENNFNKSEKVEMLKVYTCEHCKSKIQVEESDKTIGVLGLKYFICPCCNRENCTDENISLTKDNIEYPLHFYVSHKNKCDCNTVDDENNEKITQEIRRMCNLLWNNTDLTYTYTQAYGVTIFVLNMAGDGVYDIYVCRNVDESNVASNPDDPYFKNC